MKFLVVQDVYVATIVYLRALGHDVVTAAELGLEEAADEFLLERAEEQNRILITRDRDYGSLVFLKISRSRGYLAARAAAHAGSRPHRTRNSVA